MRLSFDERLRISIALGSVRSPGDLSPDEIADSHRKTVDLAVAAGFTTERAAEVADEVQRTLTAFVDALRAAADAARAVLSQADTLTEELTNNARTA